jgi:hypothetical protein
MTDDEIGGTYTTTTTSGGSVGEYKIKQKLKKKCTTIQH